MAFSKQDQKAGLISVALPVGLKKVLTLPRDLGFAFLSLSSVLLYRMLDLDNFYCKFLVCFLFFFLLELNSYF